MPISTSVNYVTYVNTLNRSSISFRIPKLLAEIDRSLTSARTIRTLSEEQSEFWNANPSLYSRFCIFNSDYVFQNGFSRGGSFSIARFADLTPSDIENFANLPFLERAVVNSYVQVDENRFSLYDFQANFETLPSNFSSKWFLLPSLIRKSQIMNHSNFVRTSIERYIDLFHFILESTLIPKVCLLCVCVVCVFVSFCMFVYVFLQFSNFKTKTGQSTSNRGFMFRSQIHKISKFTDV